jgi:hypothetical protein
MQKLPMLSLPKIQRKKNKSILNYESLDRP